jgi:hypothetical protein
MRLANNLLFYWHELFACRAALCRPRHPPPRALSSSQRKQGVWPGGSAVVGMSSLHATATSYSIRHFRVRAWRRCANQERRPARPDLLEGGKGLVPLRVALSPLHPLHPRPRRSWCEEQEVRQSGSLYAWCTYQVVIEQGGANGLLLATCDPPFLA